MIAARNQQRQSHAAATDTDTDLPVAAVDTCRALGRSPQVQDLPKGLDA